MTKKRWTTQPRATAIHQSTIAPTMKICLAQPEVSKLPFEDMAHIKLSYDFDLEISAGSVLGF